MRKCSVGTRRLRGRLAVLYWWRCATRGSAGGGATVGHGNVQCEEMASARSVRRARLLAVDSERAVVRALSPKPIDILV